MKDRNDNSTETAGKRLPEDGSPSGAVRLTYEKVLRDVSNSIGGDLTVSVDVAGSRWLRIRARDQQGTAYQVQFAPIQSATPAPVLPTSLTAESGAAHHHHDDDNDDDDDDDVDECVDCSSGICRVVQCPPGNG